MLFILWFGRLDRPTRDLDLLGSGEISEETLRAIFADVCCARVKSDGLEFDTDSITVQEIRENQVYQGLRVKIRGRLGNARVGVQVDVGVGDAITPEPTEMDYPTLLDLPSPRLKTYPRETVVSEKLNAMVQLGLRNSRMKDFFDLWLMSRSFEFDGIVLAESVRRTFDRRQTPLEPQPVCFQEAFGGDTSKQTQWKALIQRGRLMDVPNEFHAVMEQIRRFLHPVLIASAEHRVFDMQWPLGGPWQPRS